MALYHKWDVKNSFAYVLQFFSLISDGLGGVVPAAIILSYCLGYACKNSGVPIPGLGNVDLWSILVKNEPQARNH